MLRHDMCIMMLLLSITSQDRFLSYLCKVRSHIILMILMMKYIQHTVVCVITSIIQHVRCKRRTLWQPLWQLWQLQHHDIWNCTCTILYTVVTAHDCLWYLPWHIYYISLSGLWCRVSSITVHLKHLYSTGMFSAWISDTSLAKPFWVFSEPGFYSLKWCFMMFLIQ